VKAKFIETVEAGYGHAEEQFIPLIYLDHPELFEFYYGYYTQIVTNYHGIRENPDITIEAFIPKSRLNSQHQLAYDACKAVKKSLDEGIIKLKPAHIAKLYDELLIASWWLGKRDEAVEVVRTLAKSCDESSQEGRDLLAYVKSNIHHILRNTDFILDSIRELNTRPRILLTTMDYEKYLDTHHVFVVGDYELTNKMFVTSNPVIRPADHKLNIKYMA
jgi:hypothetical protein